MYAAALTGLGGKPLLRPETIAEFSSPPLTGPDLVTGDLDAFGLGFERPATDPRSGLAYSYVRRRFAFPGGTAPENARLIQALTDGAARLV